MRSLKDQIASKCKYFSGLMNDSCSIGIKYSEVRIDKPYKFPCLNTGGECSKAEYLSEDEVNSEIEQINLMEKRVLVAYANIKTKFKETNSYVGKLICECGGELNYTIAKSNGHVWAKCKGCQLYFNE